MADTELTAEDVERQKQRRRAAMAAPLADEGDVAFGGMAGIAVLAAILAALFAFFGFAGAPDTDGGAEVEVPEVTVPEETSEVDLPGMLGVLQSNGYEGLELVADGGVVTARGEVDDEATRFEVLSLIAAQPNVVEVIDRLTIASPDVGAAAATVEVSDDSILLRGTVPSDAAGDALRGFATANYSAEQIIDELEVLEGAAPATVTLSGTVKNSEIGSNLQSGLLSLGGFTG